MVLLALFSCKRVQEPTDVPATQSPAPVSKKALREKPAIQIPEPIAVGHARVALVIETVLPPAKSADAADPCRKVACRATARVQNVMGFGSSFTSALADGQLVELFFPMTMADPAHGTALSAGEALVADLQNPLVGSTTFIVSKFARP